MCPGLLYVRTQEKKKCLHLMVCVVVFRDGVSLCSCGCPATCSVEQAGLTFESHLSLPPECWDWRYVLLPPGPPKHFMCNCSCRDDSVCKMLTFRHGYPSLSPRTHIKRLSTVVCSCNFSDYEAETRRSSRLASYHFSQILVQWETHIKKEKKDG